MGHKIRRRLGYFGRRLNLETMIRLSGQSDIFPFYHVVSDWHLPHIRHLYRYRRVDDFEKDLDQLLKWFEPISFADYLKDQKKGKKRRMILSFDDGLSECHQVIAPILRKKGVPAAFFLNNHFIDNRGLFFRYKASLIIDQILIDCKSKEKASEYLVIPEEQVVDAILMVKYNQQALLDELAPQMEVDFTEIMKEDPVYVNSQQVMELVQWGFEIGGHSPDHADFSSLSPEKMIHHVNTSIDDLQRRFAISSRLFSFPFTSDGVPESVIDTLLNNHHVEILLGTAGIKKTRKPAFIHRIPMEEFEMPALEALKSEYLYYLLKKALGRNTARY